MANIAVSFVPNFGFLNINGKFINLPVKEIDFSSCIVKCKLSNLFLGKFR